MSGLSNSNRVEPLGYQVINKTVVDTILNGRTYGARVMGKGEAMTGKSFDIPVRISNAVGTYYTGAETFSSAATDDLITLSYKHTGYQIEAVSLFLESLANDGSSGAIDLDTYKLESACADAIQQIGANVYGIGGSNQPLGLGAIVDDGTDVGTIGGQSRTTYTILRATRTAAAGGVLSLSVLDTVNDTIRAASVESEEPNIHVTTKTVQTLYGSLLQPQMRNNYDYDGGMSVPLRGDEMVRKAELKGMAGFTAYAYRGRPVIADDACTSGNWFQLNERYFGWKGRASVPSKWAGKMEKVSFDTPSTMSGLPASSDYKPAKAVGWFYQPYMVMPNQAIQVARYHVVGQMWGSQFRRQGRNTGFTTI